MTHKNRQLFLEDIIEIIPGHLYWKDLDGRYLGCNQQQVKDLGFSSIEEIVGKTDYDFFPKIEADCIRAFDQQVINSKIEITAEEPVKNEKGDIVYYLSKKAPIFDRDGKVIGVIGTSFDVTQEQKEKINLTTQKRQIEITLNKIISLLPGHVYWKDRQGIFLGCNLSQAKSAGFHSPTEFVGKTDYDLYSKEQADKIVSVDQQIMKKAQPFMAEEIVDTTEGKTISYLSHKVPLVDDNNHIIGILGISFDITERKKLEQELIESKNREIKTMAAIGGMIAHELRTPLASIELNAQIIKECLPTLLKAYHEYSKISGIEKLRKVQLHVLDDIAEDIEQSAQYSSNTIRTILSGFHYTTSEAQSLTEVDVNTAIQTALKNYPLNKEERALISLKSTGECKALASEEIIIHVLHNLLKNALYAIRAANKGTITISLEKLKENDIQLIFKDAAKGISEEVLKHIFEPFYTTKDSETSIGLGLYFCKMALGKMNASITCDSKVGEYTIFTIKFKGLPIKPS